MKSCINISLDKVVTPFNIDFKRNNSSINIKANKHNSSINIKCGLVCGINNSLYLEVPQESIWLLPDNNFSQDVVVYANVEWTIE